MRRAPLSTTTGRERTPLIAARHACHFSQDEVAAQLGVSKTTVHWWERAGDVSVTQTSTDPHHEAAAEANALTAFRRHHLTSRLMIPIWNWPPGDARYQKLQWLIIAELEDNAMSNELTHA
jgi:transcriptional regulator with XRE-family HTH domain